MYVNECVSALQNVDMEVFFKEFALLDVICDKRLKGIEEQNRILSGTVLDTDTCVVKYLYTSGALKSYFYTPKTNEADKSFTFTTDHSVLDPDALSLIFGSDLWKQGKKFNVAYTSTNNEAKETVISKLSTCYLTSITKKLCLFDDTILHVTQVMQSGKNVPFSTQYFTSPLKDQQAVKACIGSIGGAYSRGNFGCAKKSCS
jgi:hypothetical protein